MHVRCCSLYSTSCEHDARPRASTINEMGLRHCKVRSPMLVVKTRLARRAWIAPSLPAHANPSVVQFLANRVQNERVRLTTRDGLRESDENKPRFTRLSLRDSLKLAMAGTSERTKFAQAGSRAAHPDSPR